jgi:fatty acid elongase 3
MADRQAMSLTWVVAAHNAFLLVWSAGMFAMLAVAIYHQHATYGVRALFCAENDDQVHSHMHYWLYIFYLSKFYELLDTVVLRLKKKPVIFLHWYHHSVVLAMTWSWINFQMNFACLGMLANTLVHVFMYCYYFCAAIKVKVWFKVRTCNASIFYQIIHP